MTGPLPLAPATPDSSAAVADALAAAVPLLAGELAPALEAVTDGEAVAAALVLAEPAGLVGDCVVVLLCVAVAETDAVAVAVTDAVDAALTDPVRV